jgi:hypothetical protein
MSAALTDAVHRSERSITVARALFRDGLLPESHDHMLGSLRVLLDAWGRLAPAADAEAGVPKLTTLERALTALERAGYGQVAHLRAAVVTSGAAEMPPSPSAALPLPSGELDRIWTQVELLARFTNRQAMAPRARRMARWRRLAALGALLALTLLLALRVWRRPHARSSADLSEAHAVANAVDGLDATEWLLPDATAGWVDVTFGSPRAVQGVRLVNAHNVFYMDRGARAVRATAFTEWGLATSVDGAFAGLEDGRSVLELPLAAERVTRVRVEVLSYFQRGGGLAEIELR